MASQIELPKYLWGCTGKEAYDNKRDARKALDRAQKRREKQHKEKSDGWRTLREYHCEFCNKWHLGRLRG